MILQLIFILLLGVGILIYLPSKSKYNHFIEALDKKQYPLKVLLPFGLFILEQCGYQYQTAYDKGFLMKFNELYGIKKGRDYLKVHWANQLTCFYLIILLITLFLGAQGGTPDEGSILFALVIPITAIYGLNQEIQKQVKKRQLLLKLDFVEFLNKLILLLNAGMTLSRAMQKIAAESKRERPLYQELSITISEINGGKSESEAYEDFANRCRIPEVFKFITLVLQNIKKGNNELVSMLRLLSNECWIMRKNNAKILGEEASTKLLLPMMIMFAAILSIVMTPAIIAFSMM